jgi:electron transport complex protein RnfG
MNYRQIAITTVILLLFALVGAALVAFTHDSTRERIAANERATLLRKLHQLLPPERFDNALLEDRVELQDGILSGGSGQALPVYRARLQGKPVALVIASIAPDGYSGNIRLLVGINADGTLSGVRVVSHRETPGLGDAIEEDRSDWIHRFTGLSLSSPPGERWAVKRDHGDFDQLTGATITSRAVIKAVKRTLLYYRDNQAALFAPVEGNAENE